MKTLGERPPKQLDAITVLLCALIAVYGASRFLQVFPGRVPMLGVVVLHVVPPLVFALIHGAKVYGLRGIVAFFALCFVVGTIVENFGVITGFPFGHYYFTDVMGPKLWHVPIFLGLVYLGMGYLSWTLACVILGQRAPTLAHSQNGCATMGSQGPLNGSRVVTLPLIAAFIMVSWDLCLDPVWSTVVHAWIWQQGGAYFGVPVSNFLGWYLHVYILYQLFALYLRGRPTNFRAVPSLYWRLAVVFYGVSAAGNLLLLIPRPGLSEVADPTGKVWQVSSITAACALASMLTMGAFALLAWLRLSNRDSVSHSGSSQIRHAL